MLTLNADDHPMCKLMHKPDLKRPLNEQDKRMVVILPQGSYEAWLDAPVECSFEFVRQYSAELLRMTPGPIERPQMSLF